MSDEEKFGGITIDSLRQDAQREKLAKRVPDAVVVGLTPRQIIERLRQRAVDHASFMNLFEVFPQASVEEIPAIKRLARELMAHIDRFGRSIDDGS